MKRVFVTGTDSAIGKTVACCALMQKLSQEGKQVVGYKPIGRNSLQTAEGLRNPDALVLQAASGLKLAYDAINPLAYEDDEVSVLCSKPINYAVLSQGLASLSMLADTVIVEGTGGWRNLLCDLRPLSDWVVQEQLPVIMVVGIQSGCINHALLTSQAILADGLPLVGWIANRINPGLAHYAEIIAVLSEKLPAPLLGEIPYLPRPEQRSLADYLCGM
ncbi:dethiobiotin synthase [Erwinia sp. OLTSP20]|uniref:dethiobiotin synthase n=1 Tax=unclassified Erwinia TaxID=2622719 RepID=UPI000C18468A|nr:MULTISPECIES: dethiobiotin synthase [unclassified Erwinia]PIJ51694.1 dethiobiotin synthase [Erwinia sp. OAMSP11]PIJ75581.1 dethiobiotin synthase [Erwinia sp. OLSSP12]PIJ84886.1 dethiobiotin synthase [Erwinia sp. OLCASP19]PIJ86665.1 dethiobiotin synthase [Erwinia sp. OLMTSP26]PIJ88106.1 dethiobiotin synthase [Erwinia sp. OLMDSP33]